MSAFKSSKHQSCQPKAHITAITPSTTRAEFLVYGFVKQIVLKRTIPTDIKHVCFLFLDPNEFELHPLKWEKQLIKKGRTKTQVFIWGKACPPNMFPNRSDQLKPYHVDHLSRKSIWSVAAAKEGEHCFGIGKNDWCFVWGQTKQIGALGLGRTNCHNTTPFLIRALKKQRVKQACCSALHSLCITDQLIIYGWGSRLLTLLQTDASKPEPLEYLNGKGIQHLRACNTHSLAWRSDSTQIYSFGINGPWLGYDSDMDANTKTFGKMKLETNQYNCVYWIKMADCSSEYTLVINNMGRFGACGMNKHGRMGIGEYIKCSSKVIWNNDCNNIVLCSAGVNHAGFVDNEGFVYTTGLGDSRRLGHADTATLWVPKRVESMKDARVCRIECVEERTLVITQQGNLIRFGKEVVTGRIHVDPYMYDYLNGFRIYDICGGKEFNVAIGVRSREPIPSPSIYNLPIDYRSSSFGVSSYQCDQFIQVPKNVVYGWQGGNQGQISQSNPTQDVAYGGSHIYYGNNATSIFCGSRDPFETSNITLQCQQCGHLDLYSSVLRETSQKLCGKCKKGVMIRRSFQHT